MLPPPRRPHSAHTASRKQNTQHSTHTTRPSISPRAVGGMLRVLRPRLGVRGHAILPRPKGVGPGCVRRGRQRLSTTAEPSKPAGSPNAGAGADEEPGWPLKVCLCVYSSVSLPGDCIICALASARSQISLGGLSKAEARALTTCPLAVHPHVRSTNDLRMMCTDSPRTHTYASPLRSSCVIPHAAVQPAPCPCSLMKGAPSVGPGL